MKKLNTEVRQRMFNILLVAPLPLVIILYFYKSSVDLYYSTNLLFNMLIATSLSVSVVSFLMLYLQTGFKKRPLKHQSTNEVEFTTKIQNINNKLDNLENRINDSAVNMSKEKENELQELIKSRLINEASNKLMVDLVKKANNKMELEHIAVRLNHIIMRLIREIDSLNRRSNLNLALGITITASGLAILSLFVFNGSLKYDNTSSFLMTFLPRISLVLFIEVFAYFFLSLYKASLSEIKYYQNELTKIETKYTALITAINLESNEVLSEVLREFSSDTTSSVQTEEVKIQDTKVSPNEAVELLKKIMDLTKKS